MYGSIHSPIPEMSHSIIKQYKLNDYMNINRALREPKRYMTPKVQSQIDQLDNAISTVGKSDMVVYRGVTFPIQGKIAFNEPAYSSTSVKCAVSDTFTDRQSRCCVLRITVPASIRRYHYATDDGDDEEKENEDEIVLERGLEYYDIKDTGRRCGENSSKIYECNVRKYAEPRVSVKTKTLSTSRTKKRASKEMSLDDLDKMLDEILAEDTASKSKSKSKSKHKGGSRGRLRSSKGCYYRRIRKSLRKSLRSSRRR